MIITKTPFRMSFFGGGTDYLAFFKEYGGSVLSTTFDKYCYVIARPLLPFFSFKNQITYSKIERTYSRDEIEHPAVRNAMKYLDMHDLRLVYESDLPARSGLGSSSSFVVGMLHAFYALKGKYVDKRKLAEDAIYVERTLCKEDGGWQDQIECSYGGFNCINFDASGFTVLPILIHPQRKQALNDRLLLYFTGFSRFSSEISKGQVAALSSKIEQLLHMKSLVHTAMSILTDESADLDDFGRLLHETWMLKRGIHSRITSDAVDIIYNQARSAGALGGKLLGAGGGGFILFYVPPERKKVVKSALHKLLHVPFAFENEGTRIMYYRHEDYELPRNQNE